MKILIIPGLTLPVVEEDQVARIREAAGSGSEVIVCDLQQAMEQVEDATIRGLQVVVQLLRLDLGDDLALTDGISVRFRPLGDGAFHHEVTEPWHYDRNGHLLPY